jgi:hypothetical protein
MGDRNSHIQALLYGQCPHWNLPSNDLPAPVPFEEVAGILDALFVPWSEPGKGSDMACEVEEHELVRECLFGLF